MTASKYEHTAKFKEEAVRLVISSQKSCTEIARNLGIPPYLVMRWKQRHEQKRAAGRPQFTGRGVPALSEQEARVKKLERELEITRQERDIPKKVVACLEQNSAQQALVRFFAKENSFTSLSSNIVTNSRSS